jgi:hypothetical protein
MYFPLSGSVAQNIELFDTIRPGAGNARVEKRAFEVASYGKQLGWLTEIVADLADQQAPKTAKARKSLANLKKIQAEIEKIKQSEDSFLAQDVEAQLTQLKRTDPAAFARLGSRLQRMLDAPKA